MAGPKPPKPPSGRPPADATRLLHGAYDPFSHHGVVNPPVYRASTVLFESLNILDKVAAGSADKPKVTYGRKGTPTSFAFEDAMADLEGAAGAVTYPSGIAAICGVLLALLKAGDHLLVVDTAYAPTRIFCDRRLKALGIETSYYDPRIGAGIAGLLRPNTRLVLMESPGSLTFEVQDVPAIQAACAAAGVATVIDATWPTPLYFKPLALGVGIAIHAATKYIGGHADISLGVAVARDESNLKAIKGYAADTGLCAGPDEVFLALRGLRTLSARLDRHQANGLALARWLEQHPAVARVLHPALPSHPDHALFRRDFAGATGLFAIELKPVPRPRLAAMLDGMALFGMGYSWGGFESLILPVDPASARSAVPWMAAGPLIRLHAGLEDAADLIADLDAGLKRLTD